MTAAEPDSYLGREIAGYQIEEIIGRGGMGAMYRAEHIRRPGLCPRTPSPRG